MNDTVSLIANILLIIGGLNWLLYAISEKAELVQYLKANWLIKLVYVLVGLAAIWNIIYWGQ
jgi:uncharacterized membrane protein YuzA (DUF378 family)